MHKHTPPQTPSPYLISRRPVLWATLLRHVREAVRRGVPLAELLEDDECRGVVDDDAVLLRYILFPSTTSGGGEGTRCVHSSQSPPVTIEIYPILHLLDGEFT